MKLTYKVIDVFTEKPFSGNPLAVVTVPAGANLSKFQKQAIAKEFNLSETVFVHDKADTAASTDERMFDIFTPVNEIPFAGHPTIGTATILYPEGVRTLISKSGRIDIEKLSNGALRAAIPHDVRLHERRLPCREYQGSDPLQNIVAKAEEGAPVFSIVNGMAFILIELPSVQALEAVKVGNAPEMASMLDEGWNSGWVTRRYYFVRLESDRTSNGTTHRIRARMIKLAMEDPATGSAACALASYLGLYQEDQKSATYEICQGVEMGRDSLILVDVEVNKEGDGSKRLVSLHLGGTAVEVMSGSIHTPQQ